MRPLPFRLQAITRRERHAATRAVERAIRDAGAWVTDFRQFSNFAVVLEIQVAPDRLAAMCAAIEAEGLFLSPLPSGLSVAAEDQQEMTGTLRLEFIHNDPELRIAVPAVPG